MTDSGARESKIDRVIRRYDLEGLGETLETYWTREEDPYSLRDLAEYFNKQVLRQTLEEAGMRPLENEIESYYDVLQERDTSASERRQVSRTLQEYGVDIEEIQKNFVSHQAVHTYLRDYREVDHNRTKSPEDRRQAIKQRIERLQGRTEAVVRESVEELIRHDQLPDDEFDVIVDIGLINTSTGKTDDLMQLLEQGD